MQITWWNIILTSKSNVYWSNNWVVKQLSIQDFVKLLSKFIKYSRHTWTCKICTDPLSSSAGAEIKTKFSYFYSVNCTQLSHSCASWIPSLWNKHQVPRVLQKGTTELITVFRMTGHLSWGHDHMKFLPHIQYHYHFFLAP